MRTLIVVCGLSAAACGAGSEGDLLADVPTGDMLVSRWTDDTAGGSGIKAHSESTTASLYRLTRQTGARLNGMVGTAFGTIWALAHEPPTEASPGRAVWGPFTPPLSPATYRLTVERVAPDAVRYRLDGRPKPGDTDFRPLIAGAASPGGGDIAVDFTAARALDPAGGFDEDGGMQASYRLGAEGAEVTARLQAGGQAEHDWKQRRDGAGEMHFGAASDMGSLMIHSVWAPSGAGRAQAVSDEGPVNECWDELFRRVFFAAPGRLEGDPAACIPGTDG